MHNVINDHLVRKIYLLVLCLILVFCSFGQETATDLYFAKLDREIPRAVYTIFEDSKGFLWFGTTGGLCRYDGTTVKLFKAHPIDTNSLSSSHIQFIVEDQNGTLWIGTRGRGLNAFYPEKGVFEHFSHQPNDEESISGNVLRFAAADEEGKIWMGFGSKEDLNCFDPITKKAQRFLVQRGKTGQLQGQVLANMIVADHRIYLSTSAGFEYYDKRSKQFHFFPLLNEKGDTLYYDSPAFHKSKDGKTWMGTPNGGLRVFEPKSNQIKTYHFLRKMENQTLK